MSSPQGKATNVPQPVTFTDLLKRCDNFNILNPNNKKKLALFCTGPPGTSRYPLGFLYKEVVNALELENTNFVADHDNKAPFIFYKATQKGPVTHVYFSGDFDTREKRTDVLLKACDRWRRAVHGNPDRHPSDILNLYNKFKPVLEGVKDAYWQNKREMLPIYGNPYQNIQQGTKTLEGVFCEVENNCAALFGFHVYGVHTTMFHLPRGKKPEEMTIWLQRRAKSKKW